MYPLVQRWVANEQGSKSLVSVQKRVRPWWVEDGTGKIALTVRYGSKPIEFEKGKAAICAEQGCSGRYARYDQHRILAKVRVMPRPKRTA